MESSEKSRNARQDVLLQEAMKQPGVAAPMEAYNNIEATHSVAAAATTVAPVIVTTNSAG